MTEDRIQQLQPAAATLVKRLEALCAKASKFAEEGALDQLINVRVQIEAVSAELEALSKHVEQPN